MKTKLYLAFDNYKALGIEHTFVVGNVYPGVDVFDRHVAESYRFITCDVENEAVVYRMYGWGGEHAVALFTSPSKGIYSKWKVAIEQSNPNNFQLILILMHQSPDGRTQFEPEFGVLPNN